MTAGVLQCKVVLLPGFPEAPECVIYDHSVLPQYSLRFRTFRIWFLKVPDEGKLRQTCRSFVSLEHMFPWCFFSLDLSSRPRIYVLSMFSDMFFVLQLQGFPRSSSVQPGVLVSVRNPSGVFLSGIPDMSHAPGEVSPGTLWMCSHAPRPL